MKDVCILVIKPAKTIYRNSQYYVVMESVWLEITRRLVEAVSHCVSQFEQTWQCKPVVGVGAWT